MIIPQEKQKEIFDLAMAHKRSTSQNMPIWEHKRSNSVVYSYLPLAMIKMSLGHKQTEITLAR